MITALGIVLASFIICGYFLIRTPFRHFLYWAFIFLNLMVVVGAVIKILHLPGADELLLIASFSNLLGGALLIRDGVKTIEYQFRTFRILLGVLLLVQLVLSLPYVEFDYMISYEVNNLLIYPILLIAGWILLKKQTLHEGDTNMLYLILFNAVLAILVQLSFLF
jgi:hypothetical protein